MKKKKTFYAVDHTQNISGCSNFSFLDVENSELIKSQNTSVWIKQRKKI